jgi:acyl-coenzyme A thioesterase PaaI-like protein
VSERVAGKHAGTGGEDASLQDRFAPAGRCFGCGPANEKGLRIKSRLEGDVLVAEWQAERHHEAFEGMLSGGIVGTLLDCHSNWAAAYHLSPRRDESGLRVTVTSEFHVRLLRPTPTAGPVRLEARVVEPGADRATVEATLSAGGRVTATCRGVFVAVKEGHPAFGRW